MGNDLWNWWEKSFLEIPVVFLVGNNRKPSGQANDFFRFQRIQRDLTSPGHAKHLLGLSLLGLLDLGWTWVPWVLVDRSTGCRPACGLCQQQTLPFGNCGMNVWEWIFVIFTLIPILQHHETPSTLPKPCTLYPQDLLTFESSALCNLKKRFEAPVSSWKSFWGGDALRLRHFGYKNHRWALTLLRSTKNGPFSSHFFGRMVL